MDEPTITIKTNGHARELRCAADLDPKVLEDQFDYIKGEELWSPRLFEYRGSWYDTAEFERSTTPGWDGVQCESAFSAVLIRYGDEYESVAVGYAHW